MIVIIIIFIVWGKKVVRLLIEVVCGVVEYN